MFFTDMCIGGVSAVVARTLTAPLELYKLQRQNSFMPYSTLKDVVRKEGPLYLWKGNSTNCLRAFPQFSINYAVFEYSKAHIFSSIENTQKKNFMSGAISGMTALACMYPLETLRSRFSLQICHNHYKSLGDAIRKMPMRDMYQGLKMSLIGFGPFNALNFSIYFYLTDIFTRTTIHQKIQKFLAGGLSGVAAITITYPSDLIRRRLQLQRFDANVPHYNGILDCISKITRKEGFKGLYRGLPATYIKLFPTTAIQFLVMDMCNEEFKNKY